MIGSLKLFLPKGHERRPDVGRAICRKAQNVSEPPDQTCRTREEYIMINWACLIGSPTALTEYPNHDRLFQTFLPKGYERGPDGGRSLCQKSPDHPNHPINPIGLWCQEHLMIDWACQMGITALSDFFTERTAICQKAHNVMPIVSKVYRPNKNDLNLFIYICLKQANLTCKSTLYDNSVCLTVNK